MLNNQFFLRVGQVVTVPDDAVIRHSKNRDKFPDTPNFVQLFPVDSGNHQFRRHGVEVQGEPVLMFVPRNCHGKQVLIDWTEGACACASHAPAAG